MEKYLANSFKSFFNARSKLGYINDSKVQSLLILNFIYRLVFFDYRGIVKEEDYCVIERAINCLYGSNCLLPYRDYLKMGKLKLGEYTELAHKLCAMKGDLNELTDRVQDDEINANKAHTTLSDNIEKVDDKVELIGEKQHDMFLQLEYLKKEQVIKGQDNEIEIKDIQL